MNTRSGTQPVATCSCPCSTIKLEIELAARPQAEPTANGGGDDHLTLVGNGDGRHEDLDFLL
jgi:hypothetical protein